MPKQPNIKPNNNLFAPLAVGFFIGAITIGTIVLAWHRDREPRSYPVYRVSESSSAPAPAVPPAFDSTAFSSLGSKSSPVSDPAVARVAARFVCSCGTCGEERLDVCSCPIAQTERTFIQDQLRNGRSEAEAAEALKQKYGGLKS
jgi:hypothetical protein